MRYKCIAYTSLAALDLDERQLRDIHDSAKNLNGLDGISGLLIFNGTHFLQWVEGPPQAIDDLVERLRRDPRHSAFEVRDERYSDQRLFGHWAMELVRVRARTFRTRDDLLEKRPANVPASVRDRVVAMAEAVAAEVEL
jgi:hypothetical protein